MISYLPCALNKLEDYKSRRRLDSSGWMLNVHVFLNLCYKFTIPRNRPIASQVFHQLFQQVCDLEFQSIQHSERCTVSFVDLFHRLDFDCRCRRYQWSCDTEDSSDFWSQRFCKIRSDPVSLSQRKTLDFLQCFFLYLSLQTLKKWRMFLVYDPLYPDFLGIYKHYIRHTVLWTWLGNPECSVRSSPRFIYKIITAIRTSSFVFEKLSFTFF